MFDGIYELDFEQLMVSTALTATKTDMNVLDLGAAGIDAGQPGSCTILFCVDAITTADSSNYFTFDLYHADAKTSDTALTSGVKVTSTTGLTNSASPTVQATTLTTQAQKFVVVGYTGIKRYLQLQPTETGTASITGSVQAIYHRLDSKHGSKLD
jgi:hypothetical protein